MRNKHAMRSLMLHAPCTIQRQYTKTLHHTDFGYEVSRSLAACEGALLVVDATQGVEAQTLANVYLAIDSDLTIVPVINKIDLPSADVAAVTEEISRTLAFDSPLPCSAKTGLGVGEILEMVVRNIPPPRGRVG
ncbi:hypothetical protein EON65_10525, partial [archaeon]